MAAELTGRGALGIDHPPIWATYFAVMAIPKETAPTPEPLVGAFGGETALAVLSYLGCGVILRAT